LRRTVSKEWKKGGGGQDNGESFQGEWKLEKEEIKDKTGAGEWKGLFQKRLEFEDLQGSLAGGKGRQETGRKRLETGLKREKKAYQAREKMQQKAFKIATARGHTEKRVDEREAKEKL